MRVRPVEPRGIDQLTTGGSFERLTTASKEHAATGPPHSLALGRMFEDIEALYRFVVGKSAPTRPAPDAGARGDRAGSVRWHSQ